MTGTKKVPADLLCREAAPAATLQAVWRPGQVEGLRLAPPRTWQAADFETEEPARTGSALTFGPRVLGCHGGFFPFDRLFFRYGAPDTGATSTPWVVDLVPLCPLRRTPSSAWGT